MLVFQAHVAWLGVPVKARGNEEMVSRTPRDKEIAKVKFYVTLQHIDGVGGIYHRIIVPTSLRGANQ